MSYATVANRECGSVTDSSKEASPLGLGLVKLGWPVATGQTPPHASVNVKHLTTSTTTRTSHAASERKLDHSSWCSKGTSAHGQASL